jgi:hypothetical protein
MFVQVIEAQVKDSEGLRRQLDSWRERLASGAAGWVGTTAGITGDGRFIAAVRFESAEAGEQNASRPEQDEWWSETASMLEDPVFAETSDYKSIGECSDDAGFVQIMRGSVSDRDRLEAIEEGMEASFAEVRPDLMGGYRVWLPSGEVVAVDYFTSEEEAREGEAKELPEDMAAGFKEWQALISDARWYDLPDPWLESP